MDLNEAFKRAVQKYYDGYGFDAINKSGKKKFGYDHGTLDKMHDTVLNGKLRVKKKNSEIAVQKDMEDSLDMNPAKDKPKDVSKTIDKSFDTLKQEKETKSSLKSENKDNNPSDNNGIGFVDKGKR